MIIMIIIIRIISQQKEKKKEKKRTCQIVDFAVPADHRVKLKESEKKDKYLDLAREQKKTVEHETTFLFRSARILRSIMVT